VSRLLTNVHLEIGGSFTKKGYYKSIGTFWQQKTWGEVPPEERINTVVLKRIIEPVPLKKKERNLTSLSPQYTIFPRLYEPVGYDLEIGDWVFPDGRGKIADIFFTIKGYINGINDFSFTMSAEFSGDLNGIQSFHYPKKGPDFPVRSELPPPPIAPESGYEKTFEHFVKRSGSVHSVSFSFDENRKWIFRIRTEVDENGNIIAANYGWTIEDITFGVLQNGQVVINLFYYYNPDPKSRSLEPKEIADRQNRN